VIPERVVVTGLGVVAPNANGKDAFARALRDGKSGVRFLEHLRESKFACQVGAIPEGVEALSRQHLAEDELFAMNACMRYAAIAAARLPTRTCPRTPSPLGPSRSGSL